MLKQVISTCRLFILKCSQSIKKFYAEDSYGLFAITLLIREFNIILLLCGSVHGIISVVLKNVDIIINQNFNYFSQL